ncbi:MAG: DUF3833 family protein [Betaproteobacteria bacterium AqS2]|uniref:DUF3833 family protein n=1 Tax=Candidatus Amphirhobacter heronislandensis TaxID=1732024 RepID=A0A930UCS4_9GAMM|nr:DUF3833 family protein [Betaproteobacteria bacterium AqS2]
METPKFDLREFFSGEAAGWGVIRDWRGRPQTSFVCTFAGRMEGPVLILDEVLDFAGGRRIERSWRIEYGEQGLFTATAPDVVGPARGSQAGDTVRMRYVQQLELDNSKIKVAMDDRMFLLPGGRVMNAAVMRKFGCKVATIEATFTKDA